MNQLEQLKQQSIVVADTGDIDSIRAFAPQDATTNPSLLLKAAQSERYQSLLAEAKNMAAGQSLNKVQDMFTASLAELILEAIPGYLSVEVDARLSFDTKKTLERTDELLANLRSRGIDTSRILIKIAGTWEGIQAAKVLEAKGIKCNVTLLFSMAQVIACKQAQAFLISPFVGRIYDWFKAAGQEFTPSSDPGVLFVASAYHYLKTQGSETITMAASFRQAYQILALTGCDRQTISPNLLEELSQNDGAITTNIKDVDVPSDFPSSLTESEFRWMLSQDAMAVEKLHDGIRRFAADQETLDTLLGA